MGHQRIKSHRPCCCMLIDALDQTRKSKDHCFCVSREQKQLTGVVALSGKSIENCWSRMKGSRDCEPLDWDSTDGWSPRED